MDFPTFQKQKEKATSTATTAITAPIAATAVTAKMFPVKVKHELNCVYPELHPRARCVDIES